MGVLRSDVSKLFLYLVSSFVLAAVLTPWLYNAGTFLGDLSERGTSITAVNWLGTKARNAEYADFFKRSLLISGLLLLLPLLLALRLRKRPPALRKSPWSIYLPSRAVAGVEGQPLCNPPRGWLHLPFGFVLAGGLLFAMGALLISLEWFRLRDPIPWAKAFDRAAVPTITASLLEELIFRGILLGICLRTFRPWVAIVVVSLLFAALHFLQPPDDLIPAHPEAPLAGFEMLGLIAMRFQDFDLILYEFLSLLVVGLILGFARYATASLWLPIGLHSGWIFAYMFFGRIAKRRKDLDSDLDLFIGSNLKEGLIPLATLGVTAIAVYGFTRLVRRRDGTPEGEDREPPASPPKEAATN